MREVVAGIPNRMITEAPLPYLQSYVEFFTSVVGESTLDHLDGLADRTFDSQQHVKMIRHDHKFVKLIPP